MGQWTIANYSTGWWALALLSLWISVVNYVWHSYLPNSTPYLRKLCEAYRKTYLPQLDPPFISQIYYIKDSRRQAKCDLRPLSIPGYSWINNHHNNGVMMCHTANRTCPNKKQWPVENGQELSIHTEKPDIRVRNLGNVILSFRSDSE